MLHMLMHKSKILSSAITLTLFSAVAGADPADTADVPASSGQTARIHDPLLHRRRRVWKRSQ